MQPVVPLHKLFTPGIGTIASAVRICMRLANLLPENGFSVSEAILVNRDGPTIGKPLKARALGCGESADDILASLPFLCNKLAFPAVARAGAFIIRGMSMEMIDLTPILQA